MKQKIKYSQIGYTTKSFGVKGELKIMINEAIDEDILFDLDHIFLDYDGQYVPFFIEYSEENAIKLEDVDTPEEANKLGNLPIYLSENQIDLNSIIPVGLNISGLSNFKIILPSGVEIGEILRVEEFPSQMMAIVTNRLSGKEIMIPIVESWILEFDEVKKEIKMDVPQGLLQIDEEE
jgi:16S rRNA processing protein RimM